MFSKYYIPLQMEELQECISKQIYSFPKKFVNNFQITEIRNKRYKFKTCKYPIQEIL